MKCLASLASNFPELSLYVDLLKLESKVYFRLYLVKLEKLKEYSNLTRIKILAERSLKIYTKILVFISPSQ